MILVEKNIVSDIEHAGSMGFEPHQNIQLRLSPTIRQHALDLAARQQVSLNYFINKAISEKMDRLREAGEVY